MRTDHMLPMGAVSTTACSGRWFTVHGSNFYIGATVATWTYTFVARACFHFLILDGIVTTRMLEKIISIITIVSLCLLVLLLNTTAPVTAGPLGILAIFIFAYVSSLGVMTYFLYGMSRIAAHLSLAFTVKKPIVAMPFRRSYYYSTVLAAAPVMLIGLQSVGSVSIYEFALVLIFIVIGCVYITKRIH